MDMYDDRLSECSGDSEGIEEVHDYDPNSNTIMKSGHSVSPQANYPLLDHCPRPQRQFTPSFRKYFASRDVAFSLDIALMDMLALSVSLSHLSHAIDVDIHCTQLAGTRLDERLHAYLSQVRAILSRPSSSSSESLEHVSTSTAKPTPSRQSATSTSKNPSSMPGSKISPSMRDHTPIRQPVSSTRAPSRSRPHAGVPVSGPPHTSAAAPAPPPLGSPPMHAARGPPITSFAPATRLAAVAASPQQYPSRATHHAPRESAGHAPPPHARTHTDAYTASHHAAPPRRDAVSRSIAGRATPDRAAAASGAAGMREGHWGAADHSRAHHDSHASHGQCYGDEDAGGGDGGGWGASATGGLVWGGGGAGGVASGAAVVDASSLEALLAAPVLTDAPTIHADAVGGRARVRAVDTHGEVVGGRAAARGPNPGLGLGAEVDPPRTDARTRQPAAGYATTPLSTTSSSAHPPPSSRPPPAALAGARAGAPHPPRTQPAGATRHSGPAPGPTATPTHASSSTHGLHGTHARATTGQGAAGAGGAARRSGMGVAGHAARYRQAPLHGSTSTSAPHPPSSSSAPSPLRSPPSPSASPLPAPPPPPTPTPTPTSTTFPSTLPPATAPLPPVLAPLRTAALLAAAVADALSASAVAHVAHTHTVLPHLLRLYAAAHALSRSSLPLHSDTSPASLSVAVRRHAPLGLRAVAVPPPYAFLAHLVSASVSTSSASSPQASQAPYLASCSCTGTTTQRQHLSRRHAASSTFSSSPATAALEAALLFRRDAEPFPHPTPVPIPIPSASGLSFVEGTPQRPEVSARLEGKSLSSDGQGVSAGASPDSSSVTDRAATSAATAMSAPPPCAGVVGCACDACLARLCSLARDVKVGKELVSLSMGVEAAAEDGADAGGGVYGPVTTQLLLQMHEPVFVPGAVPSVAAEEHWEATLAVIFDGDSRDEDVCTAWSQHHVPTHTCWATPDAGAGTLATHCSCDGAVTDPAAQSSHCGATAVSTRPAVSACPHERFSTAPFAPLHPALPPLLPPAPAPAVASAGATPSAGAPDNNDDMSTQHVHLAGGTFFTNMAVKLPWNKQRDIRTVFPTSAPLIPAILSPTAPVCAAHESLWLQARVTAARDTSEHVCTEKNVKCAADAVAALGSVRAMQPLLPLLGVSASEYAWSRRVLTAQRQDATYQDVIGSVTDITQRPSSPAAPAAGMDACLLARGSGWPSFGPEDAMSVSGLAVEDADACMLRTTLEVLRMAGYRASMVRTQPDTLPDEDLAFDDEDAFS